MMVIYLLYYEKGGYDKEEQSMEDLERYSHWNWCENWLFYSGSDGCLGDANQVW